MISAHWQCHRDVLTKNELMRDESYFWFKEGVSIFGLLKYTIGSLFKWHNWTLFQEKFDKDQCQYSQRLMFFSFYGDQILWEFIFNVVERGWEFYGLLKGFTFGLLLKLCINDINRYTSKASILTFIVLGGASV